MKKPLIALTPAYDSDSQNIITRSPYMKAITMAGGIPIVLPLEPNQADFEQIAETFDGFLFTGGPDVQPFYFGEETLEGCGSASELRDSMELTLFHEVIKRNKPILGVCRGLQLINIALGGTIYQDINAQTKRDLQIAHKQPSAYNLVCHSVTLMTDTPIWRIYGNENIRVNSMHHQAIKDLAPGFLACGHSPDGIIEACYMPEKKYVLGVQWHPEHLCGKDSGTASLFSSFVSAAL